MTANVPPPPINNNDANVKNALLLAGLVGSCICIACVAIPIILAAIVISLAFFLIQ